ncbi:MAG: AAA family ATPase [Desulfobacteraceae bacterium]|nr:AAA family ATPase [Desulfobacteraceae bacterium]
MDYYRLLQMEREPFSNSPDPGLFFMSRQHRKCLQALEISLRLKRGLNVVCGNVGTGKTTICRQLIRILGSDDRIESHLILDPAFKTPSEFLKTAGAMLLGSDADFEGKNDSQVREMIKQQLFHKGVEEKKTVVLIIDEGQKIPPFCLELLRELLNYETNEHKLLQIVIFAQREFEKILESYENFTDRINLKFQLGPFSFKDTRKMIRYRIAKSGHPEQTGKLFSFSGLLAVHICTGGYPRKIVNLCHKIMLAMIIKDRKTADWIMVRSLAAPPLHKKRGKRFSWLLLFLFLVSGITGYLAIGGDESHGKDFRDKLISRFYAFSGVNNIPGLDKQKVAGKTMEIPQYYSVPALPDNVEELPVEEPPVEVVSVEAPPVEVASVEAPPVEVASVEAPPVEKPVIEEPPMAAAFVSPIRIPRFLGSVVTKKGETLGDLIYGLYGTYKVKYVEAVMEVNKKRTDRAGRVFADMKIRFPILPETLVPYNSGYISAQFGVENRLDKAFEIRRIWGAKNIITRVLPFWSTEDRGIRYAVVLNEFFPDSQAALGRIEALPGDLRNSCKVRRWRDNTFFLAVPPVK